MKSSLLLALLGLLFSTPSVFALGYDAGILTEAAHDPSFESTVQKWDYTTSGSTYGSTTDPGYDGSKTFRSTTSTTSFSGRTLTDTDFISGVIAGNEYRLEVGWYASGTEWADNRLEINIEWYNASSVLISTSTAADTTLAAQNTWELKTLTATAPANATQAKVLIRWRRTSATTSGRQQSFDRIALIDLTSQPARPNVPSLLSPIDGKETTNIFPVFSWTHNDTTSTPQAMYHLQISENSGFTSILFEDTGVSSSTTKRITSPLPTPADSTLFWRVQTSNVGANFSDFPVAKDFRLNNLIANPSFESWAGNLVGDTATKWTKLNSTASNHVRQTSDTVLSGTKALKVQNPTTSFARGMESESASYSIPVTAGQSYRMGASARKNDNQLTPDSYSVRLQVDWFNASNALITTSSFEDAFTAFDAWKKFESDTVTAPSGATTAQFRVQAKRTGGAAQSTDHIYVDDVFVRSVSGSAGPSVETSVVINEIMWDELEYIELANITGNAVNIGGWQILGNSSVEFTITSGATIPARGFYLIAESGAVSVMPNQVSTMSLLQEGESLQLKTASGVIVDTGNQSGVWFAGTNTATGIAMSRIDSTVSGTLSTNWANDLGTLGGRSGSPGAANDFDTGGGGGGTLSDTEQILQVLSKWEQAFETADSDLIREVFHPQSAFIQRFDADPNFISTMQNDTVAIEVLTIDISNGAASAIVDVTVNVTVNGVLEAANKPNMFHFQKYLGTWKIFDL